MTQHATIPTDLKARLTKPVAIFGNGVSGRAAAGLIARMDGQCIFYDKKGKTTVHDFDAECASKHNLVIFSPGFALNHPWIECARQAGCLTLGEMELGARLWQGPLFCITGSNGKTTLTELITSLINMSCGRAMAVGNIGRPLSDIALRPECEGRVAVCEVSSFQAESLQSPCIDTLIWVNLYHNHLDRHGSLENYFAAKWNLVKCLRGQEFILAEKVAQAAERYGYTLPNFAQVVSPNSETTWPMPRTSAFHPKRTAQNLLLARRWWDLRGYEPMVLQNAARALAPLPHRLNPIPAPRNITFWNDSKATNYEACIGALENFDQPVLWIGGGKNRGENPQELVPAIAPHIRIAFLTGETASELEKYLKNAGVPCIICPDLAQAVSSAWENAREGENILFSPAHSSHDTYRDYTERGRAFETLVESLPSHQ